MKHSETIFETAMKRFFLKIRTGIGTLGCYLKRYFGDPKIKAVYGVCYDVLTCRENFESSKAKWCILTLFVTYARQQLGVWGGGAPSPGTASESCIYQMVIFYYLKKLFSIFENPYVLLAPDIYTFRRKSAMLNAYSLIFLSVYIEHGFELEHIFLK